MTTEQTPQQRLDAMSAALRGPEPSATPTTPAEAQARLNHLTKNDPAWADRLMKGDVATKAEFQKLTEQVAGGSQSADLPEVEVVDAVSNPGAIPKSHYDGLLSALKDGGMTDSAEQYVRDLDSGARTDRPTAGDGAAARQALGQLMKDPDFRKGVLDGEIQANKTRVALSNVTALANYDDGKPVTEGVLKYLAELGLQ